ncbi:metalloregulator ArsR/SmtB family transcription factor [Psychrosphaera sp. B3R10]|uniref:Metalloregulator ArsR/SmtB family transcription factor n=1 Tax=Psychrosphaera algicola TaxID=3023714 RepID=A0ABT5FBD8_9GAMM|nr:MULTISPECIES: metalloregulator ArsR/SmtB family transcription factor [unclassified Psychrosphaera]MBU2884024.1 metalloregulator ArsR/SmtB family transcription factor [Psychrosphaera sp. I2R16]MBU2988154.1 metalloregulator ArsR/SmtB family transcription factor [Psychrosphaera sp. B3R10]MDC2888257.1 metalloregulator ArsR/SmtB family transcription factor [Psychrosphaera sp. G1-22]MDO6718363.1 metalloregulator ArsR/SmtB family transcription factor [Psychrosphaera sp. 1_MG-2023]
MNLEEMRVCAPQALALLKTMANEKRLFILCNLLDGELSVNELAERVGLSQSALSQHLAILRNEEYVATRKASQTVYYSLSGDEVKQIMSLLHQLYSTKTP